MGETEKLFLLLIEYLLYITTKILKKYFLLTSTTHSKKFLKSTFLIISTYSILLFTLVHITTKILKKYFLLTSTTHSKKFLKSTFLKFPHIQYYFSL